MSQDLYDLPEGWEWVTVKQLSNDIQYGHTAKACEQGNAKFLRITDIQDGYINWSVVPYVSISDRDVAKYSLNDNDLVFARTGATSGKSILIKNAPKNAIFASYLIRIVPNKDMVEPNFLAYFFQTPTYWSVVASNAAGAAQPNINGSKLAEFELPLPPLAEQTRIVEKLDAVLSRIDTAIDELQQSLALVDAMFKSGLESCFRQKDIKKVLLSNIATVGRGVSKHRPRNDVSLFGGNYPFIQTGDVRNAQKYIKNYSVSYSDKGLAQSKLWKKGTICLTIAANIGDVAILGLDACFPDSVVGIYSETESNEYLYYFLSTLQSYLDLKANAAAQKNINLKILSEIEVPLPTLDQQQEIVDYLNALNEQTTRLKTEITAKIGMFNQLKASVLDGAFRGLI